MNTSFVKDTYSSFNIGRDAQVNISGGNTYVAKVLEGGGLSHIYGQLNAAGINVFLQNSSGITFHGSSQVNVGSLLATTAGEIDFNENGFELSDFGDASIINDGDIRVSNGGFAILAAPYVENNGFIQADLGKIVLASTTAMTVDLRGDGLITYGVTEDSLTKEGVTNTGTLQAGSGVVHISAAVASDIIESVLNLDGVIDADSFGEGEDGGTVLISSTGDLNLNDVTITVDGGKNGNGGVVDTWSDGVNNFSSDAYISAKGGTEAGDGGTIEVSGADIFLDGDVNASAANGNVGKFIIDPLAITIKDGTGATKLNTVYETKLEGWLQSGIDIELEADYLIIMEDLTDGVLEGGSSNLTLRTLKETGGIFFRDTNDKISTTSGDINIEAGWGGINIGHLETGRDLDVSPGSVNLSTTVTSYNSGGNINVKSITVGGTTSANGTDSNGLVNIDAYGNVTVDGQINVSVATVGDGSNANASVDITSKNGDIEVLDDINITSSVSGIGSVANAQLDLFAEDGSVSVNNLSVDTEAALVNLSSVNGNLSFGNIGIIASSVNDANKEVQFSAENGSISGGNINSDAGVYITATDTSLLGLKGNVELNDVITSGASKAIVVNADGKVSTGDLDGGVNIIATNGDINVGNISSDSDVSLSSTQGGLFNLGGSVETGDISTTDNDQLISVLANGSVTTGVLGGNADISTSGDVTTGNILSGSGVSIEGNNIETGHILTKSSGQSVSLIANGDVTTKAIWGDLVIDTVGGVETGNIKGDSTTDVVITAGNDITTKNIVDAYDVFLDAENNVTTGNIRSANDTYIEAGNNVVTNNIITGDDLDIIAVNDVTTNNIISSDDVEINTFGNVVTKSILSGDDVFISTFGDVTTNKRPLHNSVNYR